MKKIISVLAFLLLVTGASVFAQDKGRESFGNRENRAEFAPRKHNSDEHSGPEMVKGKQGQFMVNPEVRIDRQVKMMAEALDLTPEQAHRIKDIRMKQSKKELARYHRMEKRAEARMNKRKSGMADLKAVLTPDQLKKWDDLREKGFAFRERGFRKGAFGEGREKQFGMRGGKTEMQGFKPGFAGRERQESAGMETFEDKRDDVRKDDAGVTEKIETPQPSALELSDPRITKPSPEVPSADFQY